jgi:hypothetical protein
MKIDKKLNGASPLKLHQGKMPAKQTKTNRQTVFEKLNAHPINKPYLCPSSLFSGIISQ